MIAVAAYLKTENIHIYIQVTFYRLNRVYLGMQLYIYMHIYVHMSSINKNETMFQKRGT